MESKNEITVSMVQAAPVLGNKQANLKTIEQYVRKERADLVVFPELFLTGYQCKDELPRLAVRTDGPEVKRLEELARETGSHIIVGAPTLDKRDRLFNTSLLIGPDGFIGSYDKSYFPNFYPFDELRYFHAGSNFSVHNTPLGKIGLIICYDIFFPELTYALTRQGADILVCISAAPSTSRKAFENVIPARATENTVFFLYSNLIGTDERLTFWGGDAIVSPKGYHLAKGEYYKEQVVRATLDKREIGLARTGRPVLKNKRADVFDFLRDLE